EQQEPPPPKRSRPQTVTRSPRKRSLSSTKNVLSRPQRKCLSPAPTTDEIPHKEQNFCPARKAGPQVVLMRKYSPLELFQLFFSTQVISLLVKNTNSYGQRNNPKFTDVTPKDMYSYIAMVMYMGLLPLKAINDFWSVSRLYGLSFPGKTMRRDRFACISSAFHMNDPDVEAENELKKGTPEYDKLCKVRPLYEHIVQACQSYYHPKQHISIDERMVASKARIGFKQYVKNKPTKWGFKLFVLADSSGYTSNFFVYDGKVGEASGNGQSYDVVMRLLNSTQLGSGYKLYVDNYYTSPALFRDLLQRRISACGTMRSTLREYPKATANKMPPRAPCGSIRWLRQKELLFVKWYDAREVTMCTSMHKASASGFANRKVKKDGKWSVMQVQIPDCIKDYNQYMGGVDLSDTLINSYNVIHITKKWYKTLFYHFIGIAAVNAYILYRQLNENQNTKVLDHKEFREALIQDLADIGSSSYSSNALPVTLTPATPIKAPREEAPNDDDDMPRPPGLRPVPLGHLPAAFFRAPERRAEASEGHQRQEDVRRLREFDHRVLLRLPQGHVLQRQQELLPGVSP
uniref:PiggyBac transposable element-derived protein domain-containing protein n=1 Tax=Neogobius melanostomus TaxID=47308 RepID=A0A8C6WGX3_9GOBI